MKLVSGIDSKGIKPGFWMSLWQPVADNTQFAFEPELQMCFEHEEQAKKISDLLRNEMEIETEVVKI